jgi:hypothetical protein
VRPRSTPIGTRLIAARPPEISRTAASVAALFTVTRSASRKAREAKRSSTPPRKPNTSPPSAVSTRETPRNGVVAATKPCVNTR